MKGKPHKHPPIHLRARIKSIETVLETTEVDELTHGKLMGELEKTHSFFQTYKENASHSDFLSKEELDQQIALLQDKIVSLYGRIDSLHADYHLNTLKKETKSLEIALEKGSEKEISEKMRDLSELVSHICHRYAFLRKDYVTIEDAKSFLAKAKAKLQGESHSSIRRENPFYDEESALDLLQVAHHIFNQQTQKAFSLFATLPNSSKSMVRKHLSLFSNHPLDFEKRPLDAIKALMITADPLASTLSHTPSETDITSFFEEANQFLH